MRRAHLAMVGVPEDAPDRRTTFADLRIALCLEIGVDIADIDPASGHNHSRGAYERVRSSWRRLLAEDPESSWAERSYREARANWLAIRPDWDDDWLVPDAPAPDPLLIPLFELETTSCPLNTSSRPMTSARAVSRRPVRATARTSATRSTSPNPPPPPRWADR